MLDPRRVLIFRAVVRAGSFSAAAEHLHLSQPAVSRAVSGLERSLGLSLFRRRRDGLVLTAAGERLLERADVAARQLARAEDELAALRSLDVGRLRLGAFPTAARTLGVAALRVMHRAHPGLAIELRRIAGAGGPRLVECGDLDVALGFDLHGERRAVTAAVETAPLLTEPMDAALPPGHRLARRRRIRLEELAGEPWIQGAEAAPKLVERIARRAGFRARIVAESDSTQDLVAAGMGVTLVPALARTIARADVAIVELDDPPARDVYAVTAPAVRNPAVDALLDALRGASTAHVGAHHAAMKSPTVRM